ncbi:class I SAM-dependent methyltransferase [Candidatus Nomurabacteria bacterium]|nr:class I SAM-dependent methyltransferase [Candidatus Nomurabacteria bacterium]
MNLEFFGKVAKSCHMCRSDKLSLVLDLGMQPHSDDFLSQDRLSHVEHFSPLRLVSCQDCGLLQIDYFVNPEILYQTNYVYESSITTSGVAHYKKMAADIAEKFHFNKGDLAVDIGSNVGVLLSGFKEQGFSVLGVDPAERVAKKAIDSGIETIVDFFSDEIAKDIVEKKGKAKVVTGTNVFAHLHDIDSATKGIITLLDKDGVLVIEAPYAVDMIEHVEYDTIYHQHIGYLSVKPMAQYFKRFGLELFDVEHQTIHGGTLRYFVGHEGVHYTSARVTEAIEGEERFGVYDLRRLEKFAKDVYKQRKELRALLDSIKEEGKTVAGISAPAKGNTLLNYCGIDTYYFDFITEKSSFKQSLFTPGTRIPIHGDEKLLETQPDYAVILAWNFADEIMKNLSEYSKRGGKFIIPIPYPVIK